MRNFLRNPVYDIRPSIFIHMTIHMEMDIHIDYTQHPFLYIPQAKLKINAVGKCKTFLA